MNTIQYDDIIVGAGSAGSVLAARLSEDPGRRVLLVEAGPDYATEAETPRDLLDGRAMSLVEHDWGLTAEAVPGRSIPFPRGKVTGGCSAVNATVALRGLPADYDAWAALGNDAWGWKRMLPAFRALEDDQDEGGELHGRGGPIPIRRYRAEEYTPVQRDFVAVCRRLGFAEVRDHNDPVASGVGPIPVNQRDGVRVSTALAYLGPARGRPNLTVIPHSLVDRVLFEGRRAVGVAFEREGALQHVFGRRVTLAAGAIASPAILLRSGVGPAEELRALGIAPVVDLPGVGAQLIDHPLAIVPMIPQPGVCDERDPFVQAFVRFTAPGSDDFNDMQLYMANHLPLAPLIGVEAAALFPTPVVFGTGVSLQQPRSRGRLTLTAADPRVQPSIRLNYLYDPEDMRRMVEGLRLAYRVASAPEIGRHAAAIALLTDEMMASDEALAGFLQMTTGTIFHPVGTARMGPEGDPGAVVDQEGRVRGVEGLRVADASIMPAIPRANTNLSCIAIGERIAAWLRAEREPAATAQAARA